MESMGSPRVAIIMGSDSDWSTMEPAVDVLRAAGVICVSEVVSAHRTPEKMVEFAKSAKDQGLSVIIAGAGGAAHLPGMVASLTTLPVIGVPVPLGQLNGMDSLLSIVQMPSGVPVATVGIGQARNAGLLSLRILSLEDPSIANFLEDFRKEQEEEVFKKKLPS
jgi:5-(carboxyamino)imidazole ribonucleotide mutase